MDFKVERWSWVGRIWPGEPFKVEHFLWLGSGGEVRDLKHEKNSPCHWGKLQGKECQCHLGAEGGPQLTVSKKPETLVLQPLGTKLCPWEEGAWERILPQSLQVGTKPGQHHDFTLSRETSHTRPGFWPTDCELINRCWFKLLSLWSFVR